MSELDRLYSELAGEIVFAWLPTRIYTGHSGYFYSHMAWLRKVLRTRRIGSTTYFHLEVSEQIHYDQNL